MPAGLEETAAKHEEGSNVWCSGGCGGSGDLRHLQGLPEQLTTQGRSQQCSCKQQLACFACIPEMNLWSLYSR